MKRLLFSSLVLYAPMLLAQQTDVLFIGNSYTYVNDLPNTFRQLALSLGDTVNVASSAPGGYTFQQHTTNATTTAAIAQQPWDFVVLQEQSQIPSFPQSQVQVQCYPFAAQLVDLITANDSCSQAVFFMTWGRQNGDADNCDSWPPVCTYEGMQAQLRTSYLHMAAVNDAFCAPVGIAWQHVREAYPMLNLYAGDGSHPSVAGTYVIANAMYATMFRASSVGSAFTFGLAADTALFIQQIASATVLDSLDTWNIGVNDPDAGFTMETFDSCELMFHPASSGIHFWDFGDGTSSDLSDPFHLFSPGDPVVTVTHTVTDACGRSATSSQEVNACAVGMACQAPLVEVGLMIDGFGTVTIRDPGHAAGTFTIIDALGRRVMEVAANDGRSIRTNLHGPVFWRFASTDGRTLTGRIILP